MYLCLARSGEGAVIAADIIVLDIVERAIADHRTEGAHILVWTCGLAIDDEPFEVVVRAGKRGDNSQNSGSEEPHFACYFLAPECLGR